MQQVLKEFKEKVFIIVGNENDPTYCLVGDRETFYYSKLRYYSKSHKIKELYVDTELKGRKIHPKKLL